MLLLSHNHVQRRLLSVLLLSFLFFAFRLPVDVDGRQRQTTRRAMPATPPVWTGGGHVTDGRHRRVAGDKVLRLDQ
jgi:hypothetical protein